MITHNDLLSLNTAYLDGCLKECLANLHMIHDHFMIE